MQLIGNAWSAKQFSDLERAIYLIAVILRLTCGVYTSSCLSQLSKQDVMSMDHGVSARSRAGCRAFSKSGPLCIPVTDRRPLRTSQKPVRTKPLARRTLPRV